MKEQEQYTGIQEGDICAEQIKNEFGDFNSKEIWNNELLCAQFLRGYAKVSILEDVRPEDIEDITEALRPFVGVEYEGDAVKRIRLHENDQEVFVVGLLEHKSDVDYDVTFQLLKYMTGIWTMYRNRVNKVKTDASRNKKFRYPLIIPIVYYEGKEEWTADMQWGDRVEFSGVFGKYVPDFTYEVVRLRSYSDAELLAKGEELSLVMMLNRVQAEGDLDFRGLSREQRKEVEKILQNAPEDVLRILGQMVYHFGLKMELSDEKLQEYVRNIQERDMGALWANMDYINIPKIRQELQEERERMQEERERMQEERERMQEEREQMQKEIDSLRAEIEQLKKE